jgi:hypothetical protein
MLKQSRLVFDQGRSVFSRGRKSEITPETEQAA